jgi:2-polyprenyl-3-methyl-5-hydroxy-6-metoxy-1,4-benzoquinol methylase
MATVFMKWLETSPGMYDRGIQLLTLGRLQPLKMHIARHYIQSGTRVLEIGCGTGTLSLLIAQQGARVTARSFALRPWRNSRIAQTRGAITHCR